MEKQSSRGLDLSWVVVPGKNNNKLGFRLWRERKGETIQKSVIYSEFLYLQGKKDNTSKMVHKMNVHFYIN